ncbi:MAG: AAA family ATPase [Oscillospiraceae bacterium]|nr:AAA family ATPase [Oscillospiraceae bacterium]
MQLDEIYLQDFRNYRQLSLKFSPGVNLLVGDNAQGKTNLLDTCTASAFSAQALP